LERYRNGVYVHSILEEFWVEINGWLTTYGNLIGHKNLVIDENPLVKYEIVDAKYVPFGSVNEMIIETYGTKQLFILQGEVIRHTYTHSLFWSDHSSLNEAPSIKDMRWWWKEIMTQLKVQMEEGDPGLKYKEIYLTKILWKAEFEKFERKWKFVFLPRRVIVKSFLVFKVGPKEISCWPIRVILGC
jgi:hypothetical protein